MAAILRRKVGWNWSPLAVFFVKHEDMDMDDLFLGELELLVIAAVHRLDGNAYGITIAQEIESRAKRSVSLGSVYATLGRLADKGFVSFSVSGPLPVRGGRSRRFASVTPEGLKALRTSSGAVTRMISGLVLEGG